MGELQDWRGNTYGVGDLIVYPRASGRSVEMSDGVVEAIFEVFYDTDSYGWKRVEGANVPEDARRAMRVRVKPTGLGSRGFWRGDWRTYKAEREGTGKADVKPVTLINVENITAIVSADDD